MVVEQPVQSQSRSVKLNQGFQTDRSDQTKHQAESIESNQFKPN